MSYKDLKECKIITAFITPFHEDGSINFDAIPALIEHLLAHHTDGILLAGTTAESPTLTHDEELKLFAAVQKVVNGRVPLIAGVGTNDTRDSIEFVKEVAEFGGFAAGLAIVPYYNKPSQNGLYAHFAAIAKESTLPIILYNVPGRTGVSMTAETVVRLANDFQNIVAIKEASGNLLLDMNIIKDMPKDFILLSGDDATTLPAVYMGGSGAISVIGIAYPKEFSEMVRLGRQGKTVEANKLQYKLLPRTALAFKEGNPIGIKAMLAAKGLCKPYVRLPLVEASEELKKAISDLKD